MRRTLFGTGILTLVALTPAAAQPSGRAFTVGLTIGVTSFGGAAEPVEARSDNLQAMPFRPTMWGIAVNYGGTGIQLGVAAAYGQPGLALRGNTSATPGEAGDDLLIVADNAFKLAAFSATISTRLKQFWAGPSLRPSLGLLLERWSSPGTPTQSLLAGQAGLTLEVPLTRSLTGILKGDLGYTPGSPFHEEGVPDGFKVRSTWRRTLAGGVMLRL